MIGDLLCIRDLSREIGFARVYGWVAGGWVSVLALIAFSGHNERVRQAKRDMSGCVNHVVDFVSGDKYWCDIEVFDGGEVWRVINCD